MSEQKKLVSLCNTLVSLCNTVGIAGLGVGLLGIALSNYILGAYGLGMLVAANMIRLPLLLKARNKG